MPIPPGLSFASRLASVAERVAFSLPCVTRIVSGCARPLDGTQFVSVCLRVFEGYNGADDCFGDRSVLSESFEPGTPVGTACSLPHYSTAPSDCRESLFSLTGVISVSMKQVGMYPKKSRIPVR